jgi:hypothetical protein
VSRRRPSYYVEPEPIVKTWKIDEKWIGVQCMAPDCIVQGAITTGYRGDINVDVDITINGGWCSDHLPPHMPRKTTPKSAEAAAATPPAPDCDCAALASGHPRHAPQCAITAWQWPTEGVAS